MSGNSGSNGTASSLILAGRLLLLLLAAGAVLVAFLLTRGQDRAAGSSQERYVCPMHPEVTSGAPGQCPICRMALEQDKGTHQADPFLIAAAKRRVYAEEVRAPAWVEPGGLVAAMLYKHELKDLSPEEHALFFRAVAPDVGIDVRLAAGPTAAWDPSTSRVRFRRGPGTPALRPGEVGWVKLAAKPRELLIVPSSAVLNSSQGPYVLSASADGHTFTKQPVQMGRTIRGFAVVLAGLRDQDQVVVGNAFFLDAERRLLSEEGTRSGW